MPGRRRAYRPTPRATWSIVAFLNPTDENHALAVTYMGSSAERIVTTVCVLASLAGFF